MFARRPSLIPFLLLVTPFAGGSTVAAPVTQSSLYRVHGTVVAIAANKLSARISHDAIPGYMPAMTMDFSFGDQSDAGDLQAGDVVEFDLRVQVEDAWVAHFVRTGRAAISFSAPLSTSQEIKTGELIPEALFEIDDNTAVRISDWRGKAVALTFFYGRCPLPTYCPLLHRNFQRAQPLAAALLPQDSYLFCSMSFDPAHDDERALASLAQTYAPQNSHWIFGRAKLSDISNLAAAIGLEVRPKADGFDHNLRTVVIDPQGKLYKVFKGNAWTPQEIAAALRAAMNAK